MPLNPIGLLTADRLRSLLEYDAAADTFTWRKTDFPRRGVRPGSVAAGTLINGRLYICVEGEFYRKDRLAHLYAHGQWPVEAPKIKRARHDLTAQEVRVMLSYNRDNGVVTWINPPKRGSVNAGDVAGCSRTGHGYIKISIHGHPYLMHRIIWLHHYGEWPDRQIDHINGNRTDNRIVNLRLATRAQNAHNSRLSKTNTSGFKGVSRNKLAAAKPWRASIRVAAANGRPARHMHLGSFYTPHEAHKAYSAAAKQLRGEFARDR